MTPTYFATVRAARAVVLNARTPAEARDLLDMLGLLDADGHITPDDTRTYDIASASPEKSLDRADMPTVRDPRPERLTTPDGLRDMGGAA